MEAAFESLQFHRYDCNKRSTSSPLAPLKRELRFFLTIAGDVAVLIALLLFFLIAFPIQRAAQTREGGNLGNGLAARPEDTVMPTVHPKTHRRLRLHREAVLS